MIERSSIPQRDRPVTIRMQPRSSLRSIAVRDTHMRAETRCALQNVCDRVSLPTCVLRCVARRDTYMKRSYRLATVLQSHDMFSSIIRLSAIRRARAFLDKTLYRSRRQFSAWSVIFERPCESRTGAASAASLQ